MLPALWRGKGRGLTSRHPTEFRRQRDDLFTRSFGQSRLPCDGGYKEMRAWDFGVEDKDHAVVVKAEAPGFEAGEIGVRPNNGSSPVVVRGHAGVGDTLSGSPPGGRVARFGNSVSEGGTTDDAQVDGGCRVGGMRTAGRRVRGGEQRQQES
jgi:hypothetical protein